MEKISDSNESVIESLRKIFIEKNLIKINEEIDGKEEEDNDEEEKEEEDNDEEKENPEQNFKDKNCNLINDYVYLIKGDAIMEELKEKKGKKKTSRESNILDELEI